MGDSVHLAMALTLVAFDVEALTTSENRILFTLADIDELSAHLAVISSKMR